MRVGILLATLSVAPLFVGQSEETAAAPLLRSPDATSLKQDAILTKPVTITVPAPTLAAACFPRLAIQFSLPDDHRL